MIEPMSFVQVAGPGVDEGALWALLGMTFTISAALLLAVHRGAVDVPLRIVAIGTGVTLGMVSLYVGMQPTADNVKLVVGVIHCAFALSWITIMLTADSPYRPRPVMKAKRMRQKTEGDGPGWWK